VLFLLMMNFVLVVDYDETEKGHNLILRFLISKYLGYLGSNGGRFLNDDLESIWKVYPWSCFEVLGLGLERLRPTMLNCN
jgi:hypothetical protein